MRAVKPLAEVVGENCKRLRGTIGLTQDELARYARNCGLRWRASSVGDFEAGRSAPTLATVVTVAAALQWAIELPTHHAPGADQPTGVTLGDLVRCDDMVVVSENVVVPGTTLAGWLGDTVVSLPELKNYLPIFGARGARIAGAAGVLARSGLAEQRMAKTLGVEQESLALWSYELWGGTFTEERDRRAGPGANKQKRGQISRAMRDELHAALGDASS